MVDNLMAVLKAVRATVSYPALIVYCRQSLLHQASARTPPDFGSVHLQLCQTPVQQTQRGIFSQNNTV